MYYVACWCFVSSRLTSIDLSFCGVTAGGCAQVCHGAACSASLTSLTLSHNPMADAGARSLAVSKVQPNNAACTLACLLPNVMDFLRMARTARSQEALRQSATITSLSLWGRHYPYPKNESGKDSTRVECEQI